MTAAPRLTLAIGRYPHTAALIDGGVASQRLALEMMEVKPIPRAFAAMVREARYDVSEMAIITFLMARAWGKPLVLLPVCVAARYQENALLCRTDSGIRGPEDLRGRRVGVRAYSQTTGVWLRGRMQEAHGVAPEDVRWVTFEDAHVQEYRDPSFVTRAPQGADMAAMLQGGDLDAAVFGNDVRAGEGQTTVFPDAEAAGRDFHAAHGFMPVNHLVVVRRQVAEEQPELVAELVALFRAAADGAALPQGRAALDPAITLAIRYAREQGLLPRDLTLDEVWEGLPPGIG